MIFTIWYTVQKRIRGGFTLVPGTFLSWDVMEGIDLGEGEYNHFGH